MSQIISYVSVIVPTYNRADVIDRALQSLLEQNFSLEYEIIVVDDGSTDNTVQIVEELSQQNPQIRLIQQNNSGASAARRAGVLAARSDVVAFLDSDDVSTPKHLALLWEGLHSSKTVVLSYAKVDDFEGIAVAEQNLPPVDEDKQLRNPMEALFLNGCFTYSMNLMTYKTIAVDATFNREHVLAANDYDLCLRIGLVGDFSFVDFPTIKIERRDDGIGSKYGFRQIGFAVLVAYEAYKLIIAKNNNLKSAFKYRIQLLWPSAFAQLIANKQYRLALRVWFIGMRYGSLKNLKDVYWSLDYYCFKG